MATADGDGAEVFVGRRRELRLLSARLRAVAAGHPRLVWIEAEPGLGKSALVRRFLAEPGVPALRVLRASGDEGESALSFGVMGQFPSADGGWAAGAPRPPSPRYPPGADPLAAGADLVDWLRELQAGGTPVALVVDDLQWCDGASARALLFAARRLRNERVLFLLTARAGEPCPLADGWRRLTEDPGLGSRLCLGGLSAAEVRRLAAALQGEAPPLGVAERLREHTGGSPLYVRALLAELSPEALCRPVAALPAPMSLAAVVVASLANLSSEARRLGEVVAVAGRSCSLAVAVSAAELRDPAAATDELLGTGLARTVPGSSPAEVAFVHPLVRTAVYQDVPPGRRAAIHRGLARLLPDQASLRHRVAAAAGAPDEGLAGELETAAARAASTGDAAAAADHMLRAAEVSPRPADRQRLVLAAAEALLGAGETARVEVLRPLVAACPPSPQRTGVLGSTDFARGRLDLAGPLVEEALDEARRSGDGASGAAAAAVLASIRMLEGQHADAVALARRALADGSLPPRVRWGVLRTLMISLAASGEVGEALGLADRAVDGVLRGSPQAAPARGLRGMLRGLTCDFALALPDLTAAFEALRDSGRLREATAACVFLSEAHFRLGDWDAAAAEADLAVDLVDDADFGWHRAAANGVAALVLGCRGQRAPAEACAAAAADAALRQPSWGGRAYAAIVAAILARLRGDPAGVLEALRPLDAEPAAQSLDTLGRLWRRVERADALLALGQLEAAEAAVGALEARARPGTAPAVDACRVRGRLEAARGRDTEARAAFREGLGASADGAAPFERARLQLAWGRHLRRAGERREAVAALRAARDALHALGAVPWLARCDAELAACGLRGRERRGVDPLRLTPRELAVARLACQGLTNREIGARVYLGQKAVEGHLRQVYAKLGIASRRQLPAMLPPGDADTA